MSKGPTPRHSKPAKPVTIELDATDVTPKNEDLAPKPKAADPAPGKTSEAAKDQKSAATPSPTPAGTAAKGESTAKPASDAKKDPPAAGGKTADEKPKRPDQGATPTAKPSAPSGKSGGGLGPIASGVIGAVLALGGGYALQAGGVLPVPGNNGDQVQALSSELEAMSSSVATLTSQMEESTSAGRTDISAQLSARLDSLETSLAEAAAGDDAEAGGSEAVTALGERLAGLESRIAELGEAGGEATADPAIATAISELRAAQTGLQTSMTELQAQAGALSDKISEIEQNQTEMAQQLDEPGRQADLARAIAAAGLKSAIDRGGSFMSELEAFASVAPDDPAVPELRDMAASGVPSRSSLIEGFPDAATRAIAAAEPGDPDAGLVDRLMSSAMSVVKVRKVGDVEGDSAEAIAARAETRLMNGDLEAALAEWNALPEASRTATSDYGNALAARARAEKLIAAAVAPEGSAAASPAPSEAPAN